MIRKYLLLFILSCHSLILPVRNQYKLHRSPSVPNLQPLQNLHQQPEADTLPTEPNLNNPDTQPSNEHGLPQPPSAPNPQQPESDTPPSDAPSVPNLQPLQNLHQQPEADTLPTEPNLNNPAAPSPNPESDTSPIRERTPNRFSLGPNELEQLGNNTLRNTLTIRHIYTQRHVHNQDFQRDSEEFERTERNRFLIRPSKLSERVIKSSIKSAKELVPQINSLINSIRQGEYIALILNGKSGTGKTTLAEAIAKDLDINYDMINSAAVQGKYQGSTATNIVSVFRAPRERREKFILIFEEIDKLLVAGERDQSGPGAMQVQLDSCEREPGIVILGTTNYAHKLSPELKRRFIIIDLPFPSDDHYKEMIRICLEEKFPGKTFTKKHIDTLKNKLACRSLSYLKNGMKLAIGKLSASSTTSTNTPINSNSSQAPSSDTTSLSRNVDSSAQAPSAPTLNASADQIVEATEQEIPGYYAECWKSIKDGTPDFCKDYAKPVFIGISTCVGAAAAIGGGKWAKDKLFVDNDEERKKEQHEWMRHEFYQRSMDDIENNYRRRHPILSKLPRCWGDRGKIGSTSYKKKSETIDSMTEALDEEILKGMKAKYGKKFFEKKKQEEQTKEEPSIKIHIDPAIKVSAIGIEPTCSIM